MAEAFELEFDDDGVAEVGCIVVDGATGVAMIEWLEDVFPENGMDMQRFMFLMNVLSDVSHDVSDWVDEMRALMGVDQGKRVN